MKTLKNKLEQEIKTQKSPIVKKMLNDLLVNWGSEVNTVVSYGTKSRTTYNDKTIEITNILDYLKIKYTRGNNSISGNAAYGKTIKITSKSK